MNKIYTTLMLLLFTPFAFANDSYALFSYSMIDYEEEGISDDANLNAISAAYGKNFSDAVAGELRLGLGLGDDEVCVMGECLDVELSHFVGAYLKFGTDLGNGISPYFLTGFTHGKLEASYEGEKFDESETDFSYGVGADFTIGESVTLNIEYADILEVEGAEAKGFSLGLKASL